jgi:cytochrome b561
MADRSGPAYTLGARIFHWVTAVLVLSMIPFGIIMLRIKAGPAQDLLFNLHRSIGVILLPIVVCRLIWRLKHPPLPLPAEIAMIQRGAAHATHWTLYLLLIAQPIVGWIATSAYRAPIEVFWLLVLPPIWPEDRAFSEQLLAVHQLFGFALAILICAHIGAALFHHFVQRDRVLMRMISGREVGY